MLPNQVCLDTSAWQFWSINRSRATPHMQFCAHTSTLSPRLPPPHSHTRIKQLKKCTLKKPCSSIRWSTTSAPQQQQKSWGLALHTATTTAERLQEFYFSPLSTAACFCTDLEFNFSSLNCLWIGNCGKSPSTRSNSLFVPHKSILLERQLCLNLHMTTPRLGVIIAPGTLLFFIMDTDELQQSKLWNI